MLTRCQAGATGRVRQAIRVRVRSSLQTAIGGAVALCTALPLRADDRTQRIYFVDQAEAARSHAIRECCPLVLHFIPDNNVGREQITSFYTRSDGVPKDVLDTVVILLLPIDRYREFALDLGVVSAGGYRTISPYHLSPMDSFAKPTCFSGFR